MQEKEHIEIYHRKCLRCSFLVEGAKEEFSECHVTSGNRDCPASELRIVPTGKVRRAADLIMAARAARNPEREAKVLKAISKESDAFKHLLYQRIS